jgi:Lon-like ATP-dependent protease
MGTLVEVEVAAIPVEKGRGKVITTGVIEEEEMGEYGRTVRRKSMAKGSVENVLTVLRRFLKVNCDNYDLHINFPGGVPLDGPSAGITLVTAIYSAITNKLVHHRLAMTGEVSILGHVMPVGGVVPKIKAAKEAGVERVIIPKENWQDGFAEEEAVKIIPVTRIEEVVELALLPEERLTEKRSPEGKNQVNQVVSKEQLVIA